MMKEYAWLLIFFGFLSVAVVLGYGGGHEHDMDGKPARVEETDLAGFQARLAGLKGKVVLVSLWASW